MPARPVRTTRHHDKLVRVTACADMDDRTAELYMQCRRDSDALLERNDARVQQAGPFQPIRLENRDDRVLWWKKENLIVGHTADTFSVPPLRLTADTRAQLLKLYPQLAPEFYCSRDQPGLGITIGRLCIKPCRCGEFYIGEIGSIYCSADCRRTARRPLNAAVKRRTRKLERECREQEPEHYGLRTTCEHCGESMPPPQRSTRRFCSDRCRKRHSRRVPASFSNDSEPLLPGS